MSEIGLIGFGSFGRFIASHLKPYFSITVCDRVDLSEEAKEIGVSFSTIEDVLEKDVVIMCVPVQYLEALLKETAHFIQKGTLVVDVSSVKVKPVALLNKYLPEGVKLVATHPLFGPQSGKKGIEGLNIVVSTEELFMERAGSAECVKDFLAHKLQLEVLERTPEDHDKQMAYVQALTHFIGRAVNEMDIPDVAQKTPAYQFMLDIKRNLGQDSYELFKTIENENPYAKAVRDHFVEELNNLNKRLKND